MPHELLQIDAFADRAFTGNPAAVCLLAAPADARWMQAVAAEMNLSETAFVAPGRKAFELRWFTPAAEVDLCGHATLASAHALWETKRLPPSEPAVFTTRSGMLTCNREDDWITMDFPARPAARCDPPAGLLQALGAEAQFVGSNKMDYIVQLADERSLRQLTPDFRELKAVRARGVIVTTASSTGEFDFISRFFAPAVGVDEDPVTGSAHCCLSPFWAERLERNDLTGFQASSRGGVVRTRLRGDRVQLIGAAITVTRGHLLV